jgi:hypothetical protein
MNGSPLEQVEHAYLRYAYGPDPVLFWGGYDTGLSNRGHTLPEVTAMLTDKATSAAAKDQVWKSLVRLAHISKHDWKVIAAGLAIRGLKRAVTRARYHAPNIDNRDDLESAAMAGFIEAIETIDTGKRQICARLCQAAYVNARRYAIELKQYQQSMCSAVYESHPPPDQHQHVDLVLIEAIEEGIITKQQADLILETRLEKRSLRQSANGHGIEFAKARYERRHGEHELYAWLTGHEHEPRKQPFASRPVNHR